MNIREQVLTEINQLPQEKLNLVLEFVNTLKYSNGNRKEEITKDPLAKFIGAVSQGDIANNLDEDLYE